MYNNLNNRHNRRRLAGKEEVKFDLKNELPLLFKAFKDAHKLYEEQIIQTPPTARARGFEASLLNSKMLQSIQKYFPVNWSFGKYKRFYLRLGNYIILFKKLDNKNRPMNIQTRNVKAISNQLSLPLFDGTNSVEEPILFFGYRKDKLGNIEEPRLVYLDENQVKWIISNNDLDDNITIEISNNNPVSPPLTLKLKDTKGGKQKTA